MDQSFFDRDDASSFGSDAMDSSFPERELPRTDLWSPTLEVDPLICSESASGYVSHSLLGGWSDGGNSLVADAFEPLNLSQASLQTGHSALSEPSSTEASSAQLRVSAPDTETQETSSLVDPSSPQPGELAAVSSLASHTSRGLSCDTMTPCSPSRDNMGTYFWYSDTRIWWLNIPLPRKNTSDCG
jgi:hypothetical protein